MSTPPINTVEITSLRHQRRSRSSEEPAVCGYFSPEALSQQTISENPNRNWYDWRINNWGTKWNAYDFNDIEPGSYGFCTAWSPPIPVIRALSKLFPEVRIEIEYHDEGDEFKGRMVFRNGEVLEEEQE